MKSIFITIAIAVVILGTFVFLGNKQSDQSELENYVLEQKNQAVENRDNAALKASNPKMFLLVYDYLLTPGSNPDFNAIQANVERINEIIDEIKEKTGRDAEYKIFTNSENLVVKLKYTDTEDYACSDLEIVNQTISQSSVDFSARVDCSGKPL